MLGLGAAGQGCGRCDGKELGTGRPLLQHKIEQALE